MRPVVDFTIPRIIGDSNDWLPDYPNPPDLQFDYYRLLSLAQQNKNAIGKAPTSGVRVAVIGGGVAGMTAARELFRCGYQVTIYEASNRLCGRHYTTPISNQTTAMELGAMRFPYFGGRGEGNCLFDYYLTAEANAQASPFPNPGSAPGNTGIFMNQGWGPEGEFYPNKSLILWPASNDSYNPPNDQYLKPVYNLVNDYISFFTGTVGPLYNGSNWISNWEMIANQYEKMSFSDLVFTPAISTYNNDGWLGGFGMNDSQSELFYTIGAGDGSWGAFYEISAMWFIRCVMFGFNSQLQSMLGILNKSGLPYYNNQHLNDSSGQRLVAPLYEGIQSLTEWLFYQVPPGASRSLFQAANDTTTNNARLYINRPVASVTKTGTGLTVTDANNNQQTFQYVVMTPTLGASQMSIALSGFNISTQLPLEVTAARNEQHNIASCKVFFPLTQPYWLVSKIPQIIISDTFVQDAYGVQWSPNDAGALLASYTWEDDAIKLLPYNDAQLAALVLAELDDITTSTLGQPISAYVNANDATVIHWSQQPTYHGCAKLYRQRNWTQNYALLAYNQQHGGASGLYFAGENYSVEGGWTEPALRLAVDAVINIVNDSGGSFNNGFNRANDYPSYDVSFTPDYAYPICNDA
jgi:tryptophan 2-monooxygenase